MNCNKNINILSQCIVYKMSLIQGEHSLTATRVAWILDSLLRTADMAAPNQHRAKEDPVEHRYGIQHSTMYSNISSVERQSGLRSNLTSLRANHSLIFIF